MAAQDDSLKIRVKLFNTLKINRFSDQVRIYRQGSTIGTIMNDLGIDGKEISVVFVNGIHRELSKEVSDGDVVALFPPVGGG